MNKTTKEKALKAENNFKVPLVLVVAHFLNIGEQVAESLTCAEIDKIYREEQAKEKKAESEGKIYLISPDFTRAILRACEWLAHLPLEEKRAIIKAYL